VRGWPTGRWRCGPRKEPLSRGLCPFDPAYAAFVDLCRECAGNRWLPRTELEVDLEGGRSVVFLEFVAPVGHPVVKQFAEQWRARAGDPGFQELRRAAQRIDAEYRESTPWWGRCDLDDAHIFRAADQPVLTDVFCMAVPGDPRRRRRGAPPDSGRADALRTGHPVYRPGEQHRRDPCPQKSLGTRRRMTARWPAGEQPSMRGGRAPGSCHFSGLFLSWQLTHLPVSELPWPGAGGNG
jgi:hypothetical protein